MRSHALVAIGLLFIVLAVVLAFPLPDLEEIDLSTLYGIAVGVLAFSTVGLAYLLKLYDERYERKEHQRRITQIQAIRAAHQRLCDEARRIGYYDHLNI